MALPDTPTDAGAQATAVHDLETLVLSRHPAIVIETPEEERADALLAAVARAANLTLFQWTITHGLMRQSGTAAVYGTEDPAKIAVEDGQLTSEDLGRLTELKAHALQEGSPLEYVADAGNQELGGFANLQRWLARARIAFSPQARELNLPAPKGILLVGVQGCGKSLAAKVIARQWRQPLVKLDLARVYDKYIGESEKNLRHAFAAVEAMAPAILAIHLRARKQDPAAFDVAAVAAVTDGFSGAELEQLVTAALLGALADRQALSTNRLVSEASATVPLSRSRREDVERLRAFARERFVPVR